MIESWEIERHIEKCPFCGGPASPNRDWRDCWVDCDFGCGAKGPKFPRKDFIKAIEAWNTRCKE